MAEWPLPVLFTHYGDDWIRGSEILLLDLLNALDREKVLPVVWCNSAAMAKACGDRGYLTYKDEFQYLFDYGSPKASASDFMNLFKKGRSLCEKHGIRILHANSLAPAQWLAPVSASLRIPLVAHLHIDYLRRSRYVLLAHAATMVVGVSRQVIDGPLKDGMSPARTRIIYNGIDFSRMPEPRGDLRTALGIVPAAVVIASAGSLIKRKGHDVLIRAFHALPLQDNPSHLIIAGGGPELGALRALTEQLGLANRVHFVGHIDEVALVYKAADVFALASRGDAFGLALAEAGYYGLPAVSTRVGGIPEVIVQGQTGLLTAPDDIPAFTSALAQLVDDPALRSRLGKAARQRVEENFTSGRMARQFEETYAGLAELSKHQLGWSKTLRGLIRPYFKLLRPSSPEVRYAS